MIVRRRLYPGQQIRQEELAAELGMSKAPLREALKALEMEGLVHHAPNQGYFTARLSGTDLQQIYLMRRLLETELLLALRPAEVPDINHLQALNAEMVRVGIDSPLGQFAELNREFHFRIFSLAGMSLVLREVERLWQISDSYRPLSIFDSFGSVHQRIVADHDEMVAALQVRNLSRLVQTADKHRDVGRGPRAHAAGGG
jgi:DNA-binding GntR family transcriptional regulator